MQLPENVKTFLEKPNFAALATVSPKGRPQVTPVWFMLDGEEILMDTSQGRVKHRNLEANPYGRSPLWTRTIPIYMCRFAARSTWTLSTARATSTVSRCVTGASRTNTRRQIPHRSG